MLFMDYVRPILTWETFTEDVIHEDIHGHGKQLTGHSQNCEEF